MLIVASRSHSSPNNESTMHEPSLYKAQRWIGFLADLDLLRCQLIGVALRGVFHCILTD